MPGFSQIHLPFFRNDRHAGLEVKGHLSLGDQEIHLTHVFGRVDEIGYVRPYEIAESGQDALDLLGLLGL